MTVKVINQPNQPVDKQVDKFKQTARELECDDSEERFDAALKTIGKQKPKEPASSKTERK